MSKRGWIIVSITAISVAGLAGTTVGTVACIHRARKAAAKTARCAREGFDPYYGLVQHLRSLDRRDDDAEEDERG